MKYTEIKEIENTVIEVCSKLRPLLVLMLIFIIQPMYRAFRKRVKRDLNRVSKKNYKKIPFSLYR
jgi:hypothetical protein